ncbi:hypothetical protein [Oceaniferula spumae]
MKTHKLTSNGKEGSNECGIHPVRFHRRGFALVATISVMVLMVLIALAMLSLSTLELRQSRQADNQAVAQANARMALMMAIGQLQKLSGPDQRVTASADLIGATQNPNWTGVWRSTEEADGTGTPIIHYDEEGETIVDNRYLSAEDPRSKYLAGWLVSGENPDPSSAASTSLVEIVRGGTAGDSNDYVSVPLESVKNSAGIETGSMAYWVSDQSTKARIDLYNQYQHDQPATVNFGGKGYRRLLSPETYQVSDLPGLAAHDGLEEEDMAKMLDVQQAALTGLDSTALKNHYHSLTTSSVGLFTDTLRSGLRADLSVFLEDGTISALSGTTTTDITDNTPILESPKRANVGPRFGILRSWADLANKASSGTTPSIAASAEGSYTSAGKFSQFPDITKQQTQSVHPVIAEATLTTRFSYVRGYLAVHLYPRIVLWNPYNVKLDAREYVIDFNHFIQDSVIVEKRANGTVTDIRNTSYDTRAGGNIARRMVFTTDATAFDPGEALVLSPVPTGNALAGKATRLSFRTTSIDNKISAKVNPRDLTNFYVTLATLPGIAKTDLPVYANHNRGAYYWVDMMDWWWGNDDNGLKVGLFMPDSAISDYDDLVENAPLVQLIDTDNWTRGYQGRFNNGRWKVGGVEPVYDYESTPDFEPWARTNYGIRFKWLTQSNPYNMAGGGAGAFWHASMISNFNLRAGLSHRSPYDSVCDNGESHHWYLWGPYAIEREQAMPHNSVEYAAHASSNGYRANLFFTGSETTPEHVYPLFDVPGKDYQPHSLGAFRHAQLSQHIWQPSYVVGSSRAPVNLFERERTAAPFDTLESEWETTTKYMPSWMKLMHSSGSGASNDHFVYDIAYETNYALWDSYFLSSGTKSQKTTLLDDTAPKSLPNSRITALGGADADTLKDGRKAASQLVIKGPFNVNSTNKDAWKALLSSFKGINLPNHTGGGHPYPRFLAPTGAKYNDADAMDVSTWTGFRELSDDDIDTLAEAIVEEVELRGPFVSISDFVNRRLVPTSSPVKETGLMGTIEAAIANTNLNANLENGEAVMPTNYSGVQEDYGVASRGNPEHFPRSKVEGAPGWLNQGDILQQLGSVLTARGDTFTIRAYGDAKDSNGNITARAWCEATVQRIPEYVDSGDTPEEPAFLPNGDENLGLSETNRLFGRRYVISSFRWLSSTEI